MPDVLESESTKKRVSHFVCPSCGVPFTSRIKREWYMKFLLFNKPVKRYFCLECKTKYYIIREKF